MPHPTVWPMVAAAGITLIAAGIPTNVFVFCGGALLFALSLWGWVRDLVGDSTPAQVLDSASSATSAHDSGEE